MLRKPHRLRVILLGAAFAALAGAVGARLYTLQHLNHEHYADRAARQHYKRVVIQAERGDIVDREGRALAQSTGRLTVYIHPRFLESEAFADRREAAIADIARETGQDREDVLRRFNAKAPTALAKRLPHTQAHKVVDILDEAGADGRGYWLHRESARLYPRSIASSLIGFCSKDGDGDNQGIAGLELTYNNELSGERIEGRARRSGLSVTLDPWEPEDLLAARGDTLVLSIDVNLQEEVERVLAETVTKWQADNGGAVVMDPNTGAVLAMASYPTFDNNSFSTAATHTMRNRILTDPLETGSVVKLYMAAILLDQGLITPDTMIDCEGGRAVVDRRRLTDSPGHVLHIVPFREALRYSSNVGIVKAAQPLDNITWHGYLRAFGFGAPTGVDLPGEGSGILYPVEKWTRLSRTSLPMGYEIALTPIQITAALCTLVNGGKYYTPHVVAERRDSRGETTWVRSPEPTRQVLRPTTSAIMRELMEEVVEEGTGKKAGVGGYRIGGKTGTTRKSDVFTHREYIASFGGALPIDNPRAVIYVYIDNPKGQYYASIVAAPAFQQIARATVLHLGIPPVKDPLAELQGSLETTKLVSPLPAREETARLAAGLGRMPDFLGMTMAQSREVLPQGATRVRFLGSGVVTDQYPMPGEPLGEGVELVLHFSPREAAVAATTLNQQKVGKP